jgi:hypothetical protein
MANADENELLLRIAQELTNIRKAVHDAVHYMREAESEVPEKNAPVHHVHA